MKESGITTPDVWLARFSKLVVLITFFLIAVGGLTTTAGAGMAFADWPLSAGSFNPHGWWGDFSQRLEHGHRLTAEGVALLVGILCAWVWRSPWALPSAAGSSILLVLIGKAFGAPVTTIAHLGLWSSAIIFAFVILNSSRGQRRGAVEWLAFAAYLGVCAQAVMGGLRVNLATDGAMGSATLFRILHGCFAQMELCLLVAISALLSIRNRPMNGNAGTLEIVRLGWVTAGFVYVQLIVGASMRHLGAGLAIPSFPQANAMGGWMPAMHSSLVDLNFTHTRVGALFVSAMVIWLAVRALRSAAGDWRITAPALLLLAILGGQVVLGILVIWLQRPLILTTFHVVNGAALLAMVVLLTVRASFGRSSAEYLTPKGLEVGS